MEAVLFLLALSLFDPITRAEAVVQHPATDTLSGGQTLLSVLYAVSVLLTLALFIGFCVKCRSSGPRDYEEAGSPTQLKSTNIADSEAGARLDHDRHHKVDTTDGPQTQPGVADPLLIPGNPNKANPYEVPVRSVIYENVELGMKPDQKTSTSNLPQDEGYYAVPKSYARNDYQEEGYYSQPNPVHRPVEEDSVYDVPKPYAGAHKEEPQQDRVYPIRLPSMSSTREKQFSSIILKKDKYLEPPDSIEKILQAFKEVDCPNVLSKDIQAVKKLGEGHFSTVHKAVWNSQGKELEVALKKIKSHLQREDRVKFFQEAHIMAQFDHPNIVNLLGVTGVDTSFKECGILIELLPNGDLLSYLRSMKKHVSAYTQEDLSTALMICAKQVASGMEYLSEKGFVHRDLAARNILLDGDYHCKICDFGLARDLGDIEYYRARKGEIPVKWTAPEALGFRKYTTASDVWSFGVLLFEMWSLGGRPMPGMPNGEVVQRLHAGYRMPPPPGCPRGIYKLMIKCWHREPEKRPNFGMIHGVLKAHGAEIVRNSSVNSDAPREAFVIGADPSASENLFRDLQSAYK